MIVSVHTLYAREGELAGNFQIKTCRACTFTASINHKDVLATSASKEPATAVL